MTAGQFAPFSQFEHRNQMDNIPNKIRDLINNGYEFKLGDYISRGFALMQANLGGFIGFFLIYALIALVLAFIPFVGSLASMVVTPVLTIGPYHVAHLMDKGIILLGIGLLFTAPAMMSLAHYAAFADVTKLNEEDTETDIIDHFGPGI